MLASDLVCGMIGGCDNKRILYVVKSFGSLTFCLAEIVKKFRKKFRSKPYRATFDAETIANIGEEFSFKPTINIHKFFGNLRSCRICKSLLRDLLRMMPNTFWSRESQHHQCIFSILHGFNEQFQVFRTLCDNDNHFFYIHFGIHICAVLCWF